MNPLTSLYGLISGSKFIWKLVSNWSVLSDSLKCISQTLTEMRESGRQLPEPNESTQMLMAFSNILKTGIIDIPGLDEYQISLDIDKFSSSLLLSIEDKKSGKYHELLLKKGK